MIDENVTRYSNKLKKLGINHKIVEHPQLKTVLEVQNYLGLTLSDGFSTLVMKADDRVISVVRRDDLRLDFGKMKNFFGVKNLRMVSDEEFKEFTRLEPGTAQVFIPGTQTYLDRMLFEKEYLTGGSGSFTCSIYYKSADLIKIPGSMVADFVQEEVIRKSKVNIQKSGNQKLRIVSGITPSGDGTLHIGNYLGAVRQFIQMAKTTDCFLFIADLHALTTIQNKSQLQSNVENLVLNELALLGDLNNITFFRQSDVPMHTELQSILNNITPLGLLKRAHAYKDKLQKDVMEDEINLGLFNYPILMAADILLYKPDMVPVGRDQKQHVEITRDVADKFNKTYQKNILKLPEPHIPEEVATIMGTDGKRKMSKSLGNLIAIFEDEKIIRKQVMGTYTDPTRIHSDDRGHIEGNMVFAYLDFFGDKSKVDELKKLYTEGKVGDMEVKNYLLDSLMTYFARARARYEDLKVNPVKVKKILEEGAEKARKVASETMVEVREVLGLTNKYSFFNY